LGCIYKGVRKGYKLIFRESTGLTIPLEDRPFDRFKGRVMFYSKYVWTNLRFGGRILTNDKSGKIPQFSESDIYHKVKCFMGFTMQQLCKQNNFFLSKGIPM
jgi:DNA primase